MNLHENRGNKSDYAFGTSLGWDAFDVVRFDATEAISELFAFDVVLSRAASDGPFDIDPIVDQPATLRIASRERWRPVHGVVAEAELIEQTSSLSFYRAVLVPHLWRFGLGRRCRTFVDKSIKDIVTAVLDASAPGGTSSRGLLPTDAPPPPPEVPSFESFSAPQGAFRWAVAEAGRIEAPCAFVVQYNESDLQFVERLLEAEGLSYFFEHGADGIVTITDRPGHAPLFASDTRHELVSNLVGIAGDEEVVRSQRRSRRVRAGAVVMRDYRWRASRTQLQAQHQGSGPSDLEHFEFPAADEDHPEPGKGPAQFQQERYETEAKLTRGKSTVRTHEPGYRFTLTDRSGVRDDVELLITRVETCAVQIVHDEHEHIYADEPAKRGHHVRYEALPVDVPFRPERKTPKGTISGVQTARVTAEEVGETELNSDKFGRVRVRFPWDQREPDGTPTSKWVRVAQYWAGPGFGALYVPRVGHEVLVAFERGDPDRPIIVGRVYNEQNPPPYTEPNTTISTLKSDSVGEDGASADGFNEFRFEDAAAKEQVFLHAQRNLDEVVRANHTTTVGGDQTNTVGGNQKNTVFGNREHDVSGTEKVHVCGARDTNFDSSETHIVGGMRITGIGAGDSRAVMAADTLGVGGNQAIYVRGNQSVDIHGNRGLNVDANHGINVGGVEALTVGATRSVNVGGTHHHIAPSHVFNSGDSLVSTAPVHSFAGDEFVVSAGGATLKITGGFIHLDNGAGSSISLVGGAIIINSGDHLCTASGLRHLDSGGPTIVKSGGPTALNAGGTLSGTAPLIKWN